MPRMTRMKSRRRRRRIQTSPALQYMCSSTSASVAFHRPFFSARARAAQVRAAARRRVISIARFIAPFVRLSRILFSDVP